MLALRTCSQSTISLHREGISFYKCKASFKVEFYWQWQWRSDKSFCFSVGRPVTIGRYRITPETSKMVFTNFTLTSQ